MKVKIVERYPAPSETLRSYVVEKTDGLKRYFDRIISIDCVLAVEKERQIVDFHAHLTNRKVITAHEDSSDMYASIDKAVDRLKRQLLKYKDQLNDRSMGLPSVAADTDEGRDHREIVRMNTYLRKPMNPEEAALQLDARGHEFLVFIDSGSDNVGIIYHRRDGNYGLIEPQR